MRVQYSLFTFCSSFLLFGLPLAALDITLTSADIEAAGGLRSALNSINSTSDSTNSITCPFSTLTGQMYNLPPIQISSGKTLTINGNSGGTTLDGGNVFRGFMVSLGNTTTGNVVLNHFILQNVRAKGGNGGGGNGGGGGLGAGGAFFIGSGSTVTLNTVSITGAEAVGGNGGSGAGGRAGGGGGGMGGNGGNGSFTSSTRVGGGGGGLFGNGGDALGTSGALAAGGNGGGGLFGNGGSCVPNGAVSTAGAGGGGGGDLSVAPVDGQNSNTSSDGGNGGSRTIGGRGGLSSGNPSSNGEAGGANTGGGGGASFGNGGAGGQNGGGGGSGSNSATTPGGGGLFGGGGSRGFTSFTAAIGAGSGGFGGGGAGGSTSNTNGGSIGGAGGFGGGGGGTFANGENGNGTTGGFGGGGGASVLAGTPGAGGAFAGNGVNGNGGGAAGLGGAFFIYRGGTLALQDGIAFSGNSVTAGSSGGGSATAGQALGVDIFMMSSSLLSVDISTNMTISSSITSDLGAGGGSTSTNGLTKSGTAVLTLGGTNNYTGKTTISGGTLQVSADTNLGETTTPVGMIFNGGTLNTTATFASSRAITLTGAGTIQTDPSTTLTLNGLISSTGTFTKTGTGTLVLTVANDYTGTTNLNGGVLQVSTDNNLGSTITPAGITFNGGTLNTTATFASSRAISLIGAGTVQTDPSTTLTLNGIITGTGSLTKTAAGTLILTGTNGYSGTTTVSAGVLEISADENLGDTMTPGGLVLNNGVLNTTGSFSSSRNVALTGSNTIQTDPSTTLTLNGIITGTGSLTKTAAGTLILAGTNGYSGITTVSAGVLQVSADDNLGDTMTSAGLALNNSTLNTTGSFSSSRIVTLTGSNTIETDPATTLTLNGQITGGGALTKAGTGLLVLAAINNYTGTTTITEGRVNLEGSVTSDVSVDASSIFGGAGTVTGHLTVDGEVIPGDLGSPLTVSGNLTLHGTSVTSITVSPTSSNSITVGGTALLDGTLNITAQAGTYTLPHTYTILNTTGGTGMTTFATVVPPTGYLVSMIYSMPNLVQFELNQSTPTIIQISTSGLTGNRLSVANDLNTLSLDAAFTSYIETLAALSPHQLDSALDKISPSRLAVSAYVSQNLTFQYSQLISDRLQILRVRQRRNSGQRVLSQRYLEKSELLAFRPKVDKNSSNQKGSSIYRAKKEDSYAFWVDGFGQFSYEEKQSQNPSFHVKSGGIFVGFDTFSLKNAYWGAGVGYAKSFIMQDATSNVSYLLGSLYGTFFIDQLYFDLYLSMSYDLFHNSRKVAFPGFDEIAKSRHSGYQIAPRFGVGYNFNFSWGSLEPFASTNWAYLYESSFSEKHAAPFNVHVKDRSSSLLRTEVGLAAYETFEPQDNLLILKQSLSYVNKELFGVGKMNCLFVGAPGSFSVNSLTQAQNLFRGELELFFRTKRGLFFSIGYSAELGSQYFSNEAEGKLGIYF